MSKLSFRARALDAVKPMPIYMAEELPDLPDYSAINRAVPQMPSGMEKEEECEHHLQRAICAGLIIPTPEVADIPLAEVYDKVYPANYKQPRQLIHMQPFSMEQDIPDYDMDSEDEIWLQSQTQKLELSPRKFEDMMDRLEKSSGQTVVSLNEAKALLKEDDDLIIAVFDYWLNKRLKTQHPLILSVKTEHRSGTAANNPYIAFRRRTEKMLTRKHRKNDEVSYEKMLKLKRDFYRAVTLLGLIKRREKAKREHVRLTIEIFEKRYNAKDFSGSIMAEVASKAPAPRPAFTPIFHNHYPNQAWATKSILKDETTTRKEKRQYKRRKHKSSMGHNRTSGVAGGLDMGNLSSDEDSPIPQLSPEPEEVEDDGQFAFRRNKMCSYHMPLPMEGNWPWCGPEEDGSADKKYRYTLTSISRPRRCIGFARRRVGRGGRVILDRASTSHDDLWRNLDFTITDVDSSNKDETHPLSMEVENATIRDNKLNVFSSVTNSNNLLRTDIKSEFSLSSDLRTLSGNFEQVVVKKEPEDLLMEEGVVPLEPAIPAPTPSKEEKDEMLEFLRAVRRDWLHFRPKTPPPDYEPPCDMLPGDDCYLRPGNTSPYTLELTSLDMAPSSLLDTSPFVTEPFMFDGVLDNTLEVPVTDTRQSPPQTALNLNVNVGLNTLTTSSYNYSNCVNLNDVCGGDNSSLSDNLRTVGCSTFSVSDLSSTSTSHISNSFASPKVNSVKDGRGRQVADGSLGNSTNGILPQFGSGCAVSTNKTKNNKLYAYSDGIGYQNSSPGTLSVLHSSGHTLTLNSHSANIFEIPMQTNADHPATNNLSAETGASQPNNKNKTIVRKNNLVMEVT